MDYHFSAESFGEYLPENWEAICEWLNDKLDKALTEEWMFDPSAMRGLSGDGIEVVDGVWERYWVGVDSNAPAPVWNEA